MAAKRPPSGDFVYKENEPENDVSRDSSTEEAQDAKAEDQLTEDDLKELDDKPIPYSRFKEVNEKGKALARQLEDTKNSFEQQMKMLANQYEAKLAAQANAKESDPYEDYEDETTKTIKSLQSTIQNLQGEISGLKSNQKKQSIKAQIESLKAKYPEADSLAVQGWNVVLPDASLEELMAKSHEDNSKRVKTKLTEIINRKKEKSKNPIPTSRPRIQLKEDERPKNFREATALAKRFFSE